MILGDDDQISPNYSKTLIKTIGKTDNIFLGKCIAITPEGKIFHESSNKFMQINGLDFIQKVTRRDRDIARHAWFMFAAKTKTFQNYGGFPITDAGAFSDNLALLKIAFGRQVFINPSAINYYAVYPESYGNSNVYSVAVGSMQSIRYWDIQIEPQLRQSHVERYKLQQLRAEFIIYLTRTFLGRVLKYGPKSIGAKIKMLKIFPYKTWYLMVLTNLVKERLASFFRVGRNYSSP